MAIITAPDYAFIALYTVAKIAIAFTLARILGALLYMRGNYDLYISTSKLNITYLLNFKNTSTMFKKHKSAAIIPITIIILVFAAEFYPTLMTFLTPATVVTETVYGLNLNTNNTQYFVPAYSGIYGLNGKSGLSVDVPRTSNSSLTWVGLSDLQQYYTFSSNLPYRATEEVSNSSSFFISNIKGNGDLGGATDLTGLALRYGNLTVSTSALLSGYDRTNSKIITDAPNNITAIINYNNYQLALGFDDDILSDTVVSEGSIPRKFSFDSLSGGTAGVTTSNYDKFGNAGYYSFAKIAYVTNTTADHIIARSGYNYDSFTTNNHNYIDDYAANLSALSKPAYEIDQALNMLSNLNTNQSQIIFSAITVSLGHYRLAILGYDASNSPALGSRIRYVVQNLTISTFPVDHVTNQTVWPNYNNNRGRANLKVSYTAPSQPSKDIMEYGILASDYTGSDNLQGLDLRLQTAQTVALNENYDPFAAIQNLDLARTVSGACFGVTCLSLSRTYFQKQFDLYVLLCIAIPIGLAVIFFIITQRPRGTLFFAELPDAMAAVTESSIKDNVKSIKPNPHHIKLVHSGISKNHNYMTIGGQILRREDVYSNRTSYYSHDLFDGLDDNIENNQLIIPPTKMYSLHI